MGDIMEIFHIAVDNPKYAVVAACKPNYFMGQMIPASSPLVKLSILIPFRPLPMPKGGEAPFQLASKVAQS